MNKVNALLLIAFTLTILFFIQMAGTLVESIYILDLLNQGLDEKVLGLLFFFVPVFLFPLFNKFPRQTAWGLCAAVLIARGLLPTLDTSDRLLAAGLGTAAAATLLFLLLSTRQEGMSGPRLGFLGAAGLGLAVILSTCLRTVGYGLDYSLIPAGDWSGWTLALLLAVAVALLDWRFPAQTQESNRSLTGAVMGVLLILTLIWFSFSAPAVIARWTEGNYTFIVVTASLLACIATWILLARPTRIEWIGPRLLLIWNILFTLSLTATLLAGKVSYPAAPESDPAVVTSPGLLSKLALALTLLLFPVLFLDLRLFITRIAQSAPTPRRLVPGFLLGTAIMVVLVFINIFSNVWGYVPPVSNLFRGTFWLAFFLLAGGITLLAWRTEGVETAAEAIPVNRLGLGLLLGILFLWTTLKALPGERIQVEGQERNSLIVMTFNTQQSNDDGGEKSFDRQLALMRAVSPDIIALQESDSARISLNNNDYVRYFAEQLGYHSYYGPSPVTGTYGTAILSKYPLENTHTVFSYSDRDEIGTAEAEIEVNGRRFTIYNVHPDGSDTAMLVFADTLLERSREKPYVIALGDYNLRDYEEAYQRIDNVYTNAWTSVYPSEISPDGVDMSGDNRIDHIFVSPALRARNSVYLLPPESTTDHPVHWAEIFWENP